MVVDFVTEYTKLLVSHPEGIAVSIKNIEENYNETTIVANSEDVGKLIGKEGRMINSIKTVISGCKAKDGISYRINVEAV